MLPEGVKTGNEFYCPECGKVYETEVPYCTGMPNQGHSPANVVNYSEAANARVEELRATEDKNDARSADDFAESLANLGSGTDAS